MATLTINFTPPSPAPAAGYVVKYKKIGASSYTQVNPNPMTSPVRINNVSENDHYEGTIQAQCNANSISTVENFKTGEVYTLRQFDYLVLYFINANGGTNLATATGFTGTGDGILDINLSANARWVGQSGPGHPNGSVLTTGDMSEVIRWGGNDLESVPGTNAVQSVFIDFKELNSRFGNLPSTFKIQLRGQWPEVKYSGQVQVSIQTYKGGLVPPSQVEDSVEFQPNQNTAVDNLMIYGQVDCATPAAGSYNINCGQLFGEIIYNKTTRTATYLTKSGPCNC